VIVYTVTSSSSWTMHIVCVWHLMQLLNPNSNSIGTAA